MAIENEEALEQGQEQLETETPEPSLHDTVEAAFDAVEQAQELPEEGAPEGETAEQREQRKRDELGRFAPEGEKPAPVKPVAQKPAAKPQPGQKPAQAAAPEVPPDPTAKAPQAWKALAREQWKALDALPDKGKAIKEELLRRETEVNQRLQQDAPARELAGAFMRTVQPYLGLIPPGKHPLESINGLMQTAAALQTGSPMQRAVIAANIIKGYGVDIDMLAAVLDGRVPGAAGPGAMPAQGQGYDPRVDQLMEQLRMRDARDAEYQQRETAREFAAIEQGYTKFAETHEFFEDVRGTMANIIRVKAEEGVAVSDEEAYTMAVALHPDIQQVVRQREEVERATNPQGSTARARRAAVSVAPKTTTRTEVVDAKDLRATVAASFDKVMGGERA